MSGRSQKIIKDKALGCFRDMMNEETGKISCFSHQNLDELVKVCINFYQDYLQRKDLPEVIKRRKQLGKWIRKFHQDCGTLTSAVEASIRNLEEDSCVVLMTAHQPNLFAYGGVLRKATLNYVLAKELCERLEVPVVSFFGVADQDFADDHWVKTAQLPDVEKRKGVLELRFNTPDKILLNRVNKPCKQILESWETEIKNWIEKLSSTIKRETRFPRLKLDNKKTYLLKNFEAFWELVQNAYDNAETYSDFNAFIMSKIVNEVWGYNTLFSRFSECQKIFEKEFLNLLIQFDNYSNCLKERLASENRLRGGVFDQEFETLPFWYHCTCGGKTRLTAQYENNSLVGRGSCLRCGKKHLLDFQSKNNPVISGILSQISARSISVPLIFFHGLEVVCYVGGVDGEQYLRQAACVAERLRLPFPPVVVWRPKDVYSGIGQLNALICFKRISEISDFSQYDKIKAMYEKRISKIDKEIQEIEMQKAKIMVDFKMNMKKRVQNLKNLASKKKKLRRATHYSVLTHNLNLLNNVESVLNLHPCIIDYAINIGLKETSEHWITFLRENGDLTSNINLKSEYEDVLQYIQ